MQQWRRLPTQKIFSIEFPQIRSRLRIGSAIFSLAVSHLESLYRGDNECLIIYIVLNNVSRTNANVEIITSKLDRNEDLEILNWLTPIDYGPQQSNFIKRRQEGTGTWLLHTNEFNIWLDQRNKTLFCPGIPGAGKTILTAIVVNHLDNQYASDLTTSLAYIYCNFRRQNEQKPEDLLLSLLKQFAQKQPSLPKSVKILYECHNRKRTRPSFDEIAEALLSAAAHYSRAFIVLDALDECSISNGGREKFLSAIFNLQAKTGANIFATSRINDDIAKSFKKNLSVQIRARNEDVERYLDGQMSLLQPDILDDALRGMIRRKVIKAVDGMYAKPSPKVMYISKLIMDLGSS